MDEHKNAPIGIFDSGVGGISVLREAVKLLPDEKFIFYGDTGNAPYGTKPRETVVSLSENVVKRLLDQHVKAIVIACNTATSAAAAYLRGKYDLPIIGMEPALKPASLIRKKGIVLSLATPGTIAGEKYAHLVSLYGEGVVSLPCPGLMEFAENGEMDGERLNEYLKKLFLPYRDQPVEAIVLGCTHYVFLRDAIQQHFPDAVLIDGNLGTVRQLIRRLQEVNLLAPEGSIGSVLFQTSAGTETIEKMKRLLEMK